MNFKLLKKTNNLCDASAISLLAQKLNLHPKFTELLFLRGICTEEAITKFLNPNIADLYDPFLMKGMAEAVKRINFAIENNEKIVIYGDYDADGICSATILSQYLSELGLNVYVHIPDRVSDGYGLNIETLEEIIENICPDLIITCDCGISGIKEVEFIQDLGVDVIVTDHHEAGEEIPDCIVVNPKQADCNYPINYLCGAGVALKLVQALGGIDSAQQYMDLAAIATIADLVPLLDENRLIVKLGLSDFTKMNSGLRAIIQNQYINENITSEGIAYKVAPRINAAGRMGDAYRSFELFTSTDPKRIDQLLREINNDNNNRKSLSDEYYNQAITLLQNDKIIFSRSIILCHDAWQKGLTGILSARLAGDFKRPTFIMSKSENGLYKGTARSIEGINIYELLSSLSPILEEFGGHSQAAGFSVKKENISKLKEGIIKFLDSADSELFKPAFYYDIEATPDELTDEFRNELKKIEPLGNSNPRPIFLLKATDLGIKPYGSNHNHTYIYIDDFPMIGFNFYNLNQFLLGEDEKSLAVDLDIDTFRIDFKPKAIVRSVSPSKLYINDTIAQASFINSMGLTANNPEIIKYNTYKKDELSNLLDGSLFGTLVIAGCSDTYTKIASQYADKFILHEFLYSSTKNNYTKIMVAPSLGSPSLDLKMYNKIIFLDTPPANFAVSYLNDNTNAEIYIPKENNEKIFFKDLTVEREEFGKYYEAFKRGEAIKADDIFTYAKQFCRLGRKFTVPQFIFCVNVFAELGLISIYNDTSALKDSYYIKLNQGVKSELTKSSIYNYIERLI